jgi:putative phosphoesterase
MRLAVLSDSHGNAVAFEAVIRDLREQSPDAIVFLGDLIMRGPQPLECIDLLNSLNPLATIRGNHDHYFSLYPSPEDWSPKNAKGEMNLRQFTYNKRLLADVDHRWIGELPMEYILKVGDFQAELYHAAPDSLGKIVWPSADADELGLMHKYEETQMVLYGHIHHAFSRCVHGRYVVNCGSIGLPFDGDNRASYCIVDIDGANTHVQIRRIAYDIDKVVNIAEDWDMPDRDRFELAVRKAVFAYSF